jgi:hypothetical protein
MKKIKQKIQTLIRIQHRYLHSSPILTVLIIIAGVAWSASSQAQQTIPQNECALITMASKDEKAVLAELKKFADFSPVAVRSNNGYLAAAVGVYPRAKGQKVLSQLRAENRVSADVYCGNSERYIAILFPDSNFTELSEKLNSSSVAVSQAASAVTLEEPQPSLTTKSNHSSDSSAASAVTLEKPQPSLTTKSNHGSDSSNEVQRSAAAMPPIWGSLDERLEKSKTISYESMLNEMLSSQQVSSAFREKLEDGIAEDLSKLTNDFQSWQGPKVCVGGPASYIDEPILKKSYAESYGYFPETICFQKGGYQIVKYPYVPSVFGYSPSNDLLESLEKLENCGVRGTAKGLDRVAFGSVKIECAVPKDIKIASEGYVSFEVTSSFADTPWREKLWRVTSVKVEFCGPIKMNFTPEDFEQLGMHQELKKKYGERYARERGYKTEIDIQKYVNEQFKVAKLGSSQSYNVDLQSPISKTFIDETRIDRSEKGAALCGNGESLYSIDVIEGNDYEPIENRIFSKVQLGKAQKKAPSGF